MTTHHCLHGSFTLTEAGRRYYFRALSLRWFQRGAVYVVALLLAACGGSVEAGPPACPAALHTLRYAEPTPDPTGTSEATVTGCVTPEGQRAQLSTVWCCQ